MTRPNTPLPIIAVLLAVLADGAAAQETAAIAAVIDHQLDAFNAGEVDEAWQDASPGIQGIFVTPDNFAAMVRNGYPMVWANDDATFLELRTEADGRLWQLVRLRAADGSIHLLDYAMIETAEGWKIDAVVLVPMDDVGV